MATFISLLKSVPDVIWSAVVASVLTLSGVLISNWSSTNRLRLQLQNDAAEKARERIAVLRREVYLHFTEQISAANGHLMSLSQKDLTKVNAAEGLQGFFAAAAKLQLVAEPKTALLVNQLVAEYGELLLKVMSSAIPLQQLRSDINIRNDHYDGAQAEVKRILAEMGKFNESAQTNKAVFEALKKAFDFHQGQSQRLAAERKELWAEFNKLCAFGKHV